MCLTFPLTYTSQVTGLKFHSNASGGITMVFRWEGLGRYIGDHFRFRHIFRRNGTFVDVVHDNFTFHIHII